MSYSPVASHIVSKLLLHSVEQYKNRKKKLLAFSSWAFVRTRVNCQEVFYLF